MGGYLANGLAEHSHAVRITLLTPASGELVKAQCEGGEGSVPGGEPAKTPSVHFGARECRAGGSGRRPVFACKLSPTPTDSPYAPFGPAVGCPATAISRG